MEAKAILEWPRERVGGRGRAKALREFDEREERSGVMARGGRVIKREFFQ